MSPNYAPFSKPWGNAVRRPPPSLSSWWRLVAAVALILVSVSIGIVIGRRTAGSAVDARALAAGQLAAKERALGTPGSGHQPAAAEREAAALRPANSRPRERDAPSQELDRLRHEAAEAERALESANQKLAALEAVQQERHGDPRDFDLSPDAWRQLARQGTLKLRVPCATGQAAGLSPGQLEKLGLDGEDGPIIAAALQHSTDRMWAKLGPLCARALGASLEQAARVGLRDCRHRVLDQGRSDGTALEAYRRAAAYLAGDAPEPTEEGAVEQLVVAMAREQQLITDELSEHFGPDEAERLVFSRALCFTEATHELGGQTASGDVPESAAGGALR